MRSKMMTTAAMAALLALSACQEAATPENSTANAAQTDGNTGMANAAANHPKDPIESAMAAAPAAVSGKATIVQAGADGSMKTLRQGSNGWTCMPDNPATPGPDPMCGDANAMQWVAAWVGKKTPPAEKAGFMYMLAGGTDASNSDPYAQTPAEGQEWIETGAHVMVVGTESILKGYPSGERPDTAAPYVMWAGTPYAHLMIPVN